MGQQDKQALPLLSFTKNIASTSKFAKKKKKKKKKNTGHLRKKRIQATTGQATAVL